MAEQTQSMKLAEVVATFAVAGWGAAQAVTPSADARQTWVRRLDRLPARYRNEWRAHFEQVPETITRAGIYGMASERQWPTFYLALWLWGTGSKPWVHPAKVVPTLPSIRWGWFEELEEAARSCPAEALVIVRDAGLRGLGTSFGSKVLHFIAPDVAAIHDANTWKALTTAVDGDPHAPHPFRQSHATSLPGSYADWCSRLLRLAEEDQRNLSLADVERACFEWGQRLP